MWICVVWTCLRAVCIRVVRFWSVCVLWAFGGWHMCLWAGAWGLVWGGLIGQVLFMAPMNFWAQLLSLLEQLGCLVYSEAWKCSSGWAKWLELILSSLAGPDETQIHPHTSTQLCYRLVPWFLSSYASLVSLVLLFLPLWTPETPSLPFF